jgi:hypothetical protein
MRKIFLLMVTCALAAEGALAQSQPQPPVLPNTPPRMPTLKATASPMSRRPDAGRAACVFDDWRVHHSGRHRL